ncbi:MAG: D-alanine--D-alanine ligase [Planctomycetes bacterium]|nr:D-alanine--D-alanine ligase [Planctomycetota bacterium]
MTRTDVALLCGGHASEHVISLKSGRTLLTALSAAGYGVHPVVIGEDGTWSQLPLVTPGGTRSLPDRARRGVTGAVRTGTALDIATRLRICGVRVVVLGLHGRNGEDGSIQGFLEIAGFSWTGCDVVASAIAIDKVHFKRLLLGAGLPTPPFREIENFSDIQAAVRELGIPLIVKAPALGSSVEVHLVHDETAAHAAASGVLESEGRALLESYVRGSELTVPVIGQGAKARALPVIEIRPLHAPWFDYRSKYEEGGADEVVPADIDQELAECVSELAVHIHRLIGARGVTRTDFMGDPESGPVVLEINTLPGMTATSLIPQSAIEAGITLPGLFNQLIQHAIERETLREAVETL